MTAKKYVMDYDWLWTRPPHNDGTSATVRLTVRGAGAGQAAQAWMDELAAEHEGITGRGGWVARLRAASLDDAVVDLVSGGEDVADGIDWATEEAYEVLGRFDLEWENLPRGTGS